MKIGVLLSGGVDSTVAAYLLKEQGYEIEAITMENGEYSFLEAAQKSAAELGISHHVINLRKLFEEKVIDYFCQTYARGETPNPCTVCNRHIKFSALLDYAKALGCEKIATGHYAILDYDSSSGRYQLRKGTDTAKDQSYFLYGLTQEQLSYTIFPLGALTKENVKAIAEKMGFQSLKQDESQEICFIKGDYRHFLEGKIPANPGKIIDISGNHLGNHQGVAKYTIGQRKGLGVSWKHPLYVIDLDPVKNLVIVGGENNLYNKVCWAADNNFVSISGLNEPVYAKARIRYRAAEAVAWLTPENNLVKVEFDEPQRAITKGQAIVYYSGDTVIGGGRILECRM